ncbi:S49 family peptidase [Parvularcula flava]|uniref:Peptidase S49 n=1 Tax=Aquisalinus luteolus TaxID=1566827 RepID=A0A8J3ERM6_9PROT|nr:S49 family peptidase [Aquisalinus luteolus]NHK28763.1 S49 family peptidase [Aquisalinus luteolus]GGH99446.1 peptidase S49 [Aquisalinus luteolus]
MSKFTEMPKKLWKATPWGGPPKPTVTHLDLTGVIATSGRTSKNLNLRRLEKALDEAFKPSGLKAVAISINSPGGSPVQSRLIHDRIRTLAAEKDVPVLTFVEDVGASGGYILSIAGDEIYADPSSVVGSIGVISGGFGFPEAISKLGVERRIYTAGSNKSQLDPFKPEDPQDVERLKILLDELHAIFIDLVKERRAGKLADSDEIFSGQFWAAGKAKELGLIDAIGEVRTVLKEKFGKDVKIKRIETDKKSLIQAIMSRGGMPAPSLSLLDPDQLVDTLEEKSLWSRYGR